MHNCGEVAPAKFAWMPASPVRGFAVFMKHDKMSRPRVHSDSRIAAFARIPTVAPIALSANLETPNKQDVTTKKRILVKHTSFGDRSDCAGC